MQWSWSSVSNSRLIIQFSVALSLATNLDLNDLDALALTCRAVHDSLTQYAHQLKARSLRCTRDQPFVRRHATQESQDHELQKEVPVIDVSIYSQSLLTEMPATHTSVNPQQQHPFDAQTSTSRKLHRPSSCARDLVDSCRSCGMVVCRNCAIKPPPTTWLEARHRRLCKTCTEAPFEAHLRRPTASREAHDHPMYSSASSSRSERSFSSSSSSSSAPGDLEREGPHEETSPCFTSPAFLRRPCTCDTRGVFLCTPCGQSLRAADTTYKRVWTWRSRYSMHIGGGLGTGLGQGNQGQKCGRGEDCLERGGKAVCWVEIDCSETSPHDHIREVEGDRASRVGAPDLALNKPGYFQQEIEGIGGVVKKKVKKKVKVGATVWEFEDERVSGKYLEREANGIVRSWCGWCGRVCPGKEDRESHWMTMHNS